MLMLPLLCTLIPTVLGRFHESISSIPGGWTESTIVARSDHTLKLKASLKHRGLDQLETLLKDVSDPTSANYGRYLNQSEVEDLFHPSEDAADAVTSWLRRSGARSIVARQNDIFFTVSLDEANTMFDTEFKFYSNADVTRLRTTHYSIPESIRHHVDFVHPTLHFGKSASRQVQQPVESAHYSKRDIDLACIDYVPRPNADNGTTEWEGFGPRCVSQLYNTSGYIPDRSSGSSVAFGSFARQSASFSDLAQYEEMLNLTKSNFTIFASINNGTVGQDPDKVIQYEANLDSQIIAGLVGDLVYGEYSTGGAGPLIPNSVFPNETYNWNEPFLEFFQYLLEQPDTELPWVITNSYADYENIVPLKYSQRVCNLIGMLGLRGRTVINSSGDMGVGELCQNNVPPGEPQFASQFPANCPYLTTVGGTQGYGPEIGWNESSGGFSFYFPQPWYQKDAVDVYLSKHIDADTREYYETNNYTNFKGRAFPDISAHSMYPWIPDVEAGELILGGGTSASAPMIASVIALINDARFRKGEPAVGFANPWLYSIAGEALTDITSGQTTGCLGPFYNPYSQEELADAPLIPYATWNATEGWDPITGLGTPDFMKMKDLTPKPE